MQPRSQRPGRRPNASLFTDERISFELTDDDIAAYRALSLQRDANNDPSATFVPSGAPELTEEEKAYRAWKESHPCILQGFPDFRASIAGKRVAVFLDYDGTLTPIVRDPDKAFMSEEMRDVIRNVAKLFPTAIVSGRGREKVEGFVQLSELYYAGSHGMDIAGPRNKRQSAELTFRPAAKFEKVMDDVCSSLQRKLSSIPGATVEHNKFCCSAHFRNCDPSSWQDVVAAVDEVLQEVPDVKCTRGRKVLEVRPQVDWDKGAAVLHLLESLGLRGQSDVVSLYIGDDTTDEDAFKALNNNGLGFGILVSSKAKPTAARFTVRDPMEVFAFLTRLVDWGRGSSNGWHATRHTAVGWAPTPLPASQPAAAVTTTSGPRVVPAVVYGS